MEQLHPVCAMKTMKEMEMFVNQRATPTFGTWFTFQFLRHCFSLYLFSLILAIDSSIEYL